MFNVSWFAIEVSIIFKAKNLIYNLHFIHKCFIIILLYTIITSNK